MKLRFLSAFFIVLCISACNSIFQVGLENSTGTTATPASLNTVVPTVPAAATLSPTNTPAPLATLRAGSATPLLSSTPLAVATDDVPPVAVPAATNYIDDRSTPSQVIVSFYNAIDRQENARAYGYYANPATSLGSFTSFASGYQNTLSVDLVFGPITGDPGMSQVYYTIPVILKATAKDGTRTNYAACYVVHETNPDVYGAPPIFPMSIERGSAVQSDPTASDANVLAAACSAYPAGGNPPFSASANSLNIDKSNFVDNRSGPVETVSSLLNALNLKQYVRAYSYYQDPTTYPGAYDSYAAGYANTDTITVTFGTVQNEGAAGSTYYKVPLAEKVLTTGSTTQTFVGCYTLRLGQPANQTTPPFHPMGITAGQFSQVANGSDVTALLATACN